MNEVGLEQKFLHLRDQYERIFLDNFSDYEDRLSIISERYNKILLEKRSSDHLQSWDFSIFNIIRIKRIEECLHTPVLAELLDPQGSHGQGDLFYRLFLYTIIGKERARLFINDKIEDYSIQKEEYIKNIDSRGEIDISIRSMNRKKEFAIIIENKWGSGDSCEDQLYKYYKNYTNSKGYTDGNLLVIYLTKWGHNPSKSSEDFENKLKDIRHKNYFPISYRFHIRNWLRECSKECESQKVNFIIEQYIDLIENGIKN